ANVLIGESREDRLLPLICKIDDKEELHDVDMWQNANPMCEAPMHDYGRERFHSVKKQYVSLTFKP
ncbi:terminase large subunit, partial [Staphylococcus pseudintermedius]